jgi:hypothetical protein
VFRRSSQDAPTDAVQLAKQDEPVRPEAEAPKGRPTPKRSEAAANNRRGRAYVPMDRKEAAKAERDQRRADRAKQQAALLSGDEAALPARDRGPVRRYVRDYVDSRLTAAEWFLPLAVLVLVLNVMPSTSLKSISLLVWVAMMVFILGHSMFLSMRLRKDLAQRFPDKNTKGAVAYALMRTLQMRRLRLPKPQVKRGQRP